MNAYQLKTNQIFYKEWICWSGQHAIFYPTRRKYEGSHHCKATIL